MAHTAQRSEGSMAVPFSVLSFFFFFFLFLSLPAKPDLSADAAALLAFRAAVGRSALKWNSSASSPCVWPGVVCFFGRVAVLRLPGVGLSGALPAGVFSNLTTLRTLSLRFNSLSGPLPPDIASLAQLRNLYLRGNLFSGEIPTALFSLQSLLCIDLASNNFSGMISPDFNQLARLVTLYLDGNHLAGEIPALDLQSLVQFNVSYNNLTGSLPEKLRSMPANAFLGMPLCGEPLPACSNEKHEPSGGSLAGILCLALLFLLVLLIRRKTHKVKLVLFGKGEREFDLEELLTAGKVTDGRAYREQWAELLGTGTYGTVYKAQLEKGEMVAMKRLREVSLPEMEFRERVEAMGKMEHPNVAPLRAYHYSKKEKLLVYDYMALGSLFSLLHGNRGSGCAPLDWKTRSSIALTAARGIEYIHFTSPGASHGNIKSSNILLACSDVACVSDYGLTHLIPSLISTRRSSYLAPELTEARNISQKADVYSFGILLLELLTGKSPEKDGVDLHELVQSIVREEWSSKVLDVELTRYLAADTDMVHMLQLAMDCVKQDPDKRPSMSMVVLRIEEIRQSNLWNLKEDRGKCPILDTDDKPSKSSKNRKK